MASWLESESAASNGDRRKSLRSLPPPLPRSIRTTLPAEASAAEKNRFGGSITTPRPSIAWVTYNGPTPAGCVTIPHGSSSHARPMRRTPQRHRPRDQHHGEIRCRRGVNQDAHENRACNFTCSKGLLEIHDSQHLGHTSFHDFKLETQGILFRLAESLRPNGKRRVPHPDKQKNRFSANDKAGSQSQLCHLPVISSNDEGVNIPTPTAWIHHLRPRDRRASSRGIAWLMGLCKTMSRLNPSHISGMRIAYSGST